MPAPDDDARETGELGFEGDEAVEAELVVADFVVDDKDGPASVRAIASRKTSTLPRCRLTQGSDEGLVSFGAVA